jgi:transcriptional regulator with XRE-family HTH domain
VTTKKNQQMALIGAQIRTLRVAHGYSQEDFAVKVNLDRSYYGSVERGERNISALNLVRIAITLEVEVGELFPPLDVLSKLV